MSVDFNSARGSLPLQTETEVHENHVFKIEELFPKETNALRKQIKDFPETEYVLTWYSCSLATDKMGGYIYLSPNYIAYTSSWSSAVVLVPFKSIESVTKEKKSSINITLNVGSEKQTLTFNGFFSRDEAYDLIMRLFNVQGKSELDKKYTNMSFKFIKENNSFHDSFPTVDKYEVVIEYFSCSTDSMLSRIPTGRLFVTSNFRFFYTSSIGGTKEEFSLSSVQSIKKIGGLVPVPWNGIEFQTDKKTIALKGFFSFETAYTFVMQLYDHFKNRPTVFGTELSVLTAREGKRVPRFISDTLEYIEENLLTTEGIFRISASASEQTRVQNAIDQGFPVDWKEHIDPHLPPSMLKKFFRDLPTPLIPFDVYTCFIMMSETMPLFEQDPDALVEKLDNAIELVPTANKVIMARLLKFLKAVVDHEAENKMTLSNISTIWGPLLLKSSESNSDFVMNPNNLQEIGHIVSLTKLLIIHQEKLFNTRRSKEKTTSAYQRYSQLPTLESGTTGTQEMSSGLLADPRDKYKVKDKYNSGLIVGGTTTRRKTSSAIFRDKFNTKSDIVKEEVSDKSPSDPNDSAAKTSPLATSTENATPANSENAKLAPNSENAKPAPNSENAKPAPNSAENTATPNTSQNTNGTTASQNTNTPKSASQNSSTPRPLPNPHQKSAETVVVDPLRPHLAHPALVRTDSKGPPSKPPPPTPSQEEIK